MLLCGHNITAFDPYQISSGNITVLIRTECIKNCVHICSFSMSLNEPEFRNSPGMPLKGFSYAISCQWPHLIYEDFLHSTVAQARRSTTNMFVLRTCVTSPTKGPILPLEFPAQKTQTT